MKKFLSYIFVIITLIGIFSPTIKIHAQSSSGATTPPAQTPPATPPATTPPAQTPPATTPPTTTNYTFLSQLPCTGTEADGCVDGKLTTFNPAQADNLGVYLNIMLRIFIGICSVLAVIMIVIGGLEYMTSELLESKAHGRERIKNAIFGLILALGSWTLLNTINPDLLKTDFSSIKTAEIEIIEEDAIQATPTNTPCKPEDMTTITLFNKSVTVNKKVVSVLQGIDTSWKNKGGDGFYKINSVSGYNCKKVTNKPGYWSAHAFGLAIDINPSTNPYGQTLITNMPSAFVSIFTSAGWGWGGAWKSVKDAMHFSSNNK